MFPLTLRQGKRKILEDFQSSPEDFHKLIEDFWWFAKLIRNLLELNWSLLKIFLCWPRELGRFLKFTQVHLRKACCWIKEFWFNYFSRVFVLHYRYNGEVGDVVVGRITEVSRILQCKKLANSCIEWQMFLTIILLSLVVIMVSSMEFPIVWLYS